MRITIPIKPPTTHFVRLFRKIFLRAGFHRPSFFHETAIIPWHNGGMRVFQAIGIYPLKKMVHVNFNAFDPTPENLENMAKGLAPLGIIDGKPVILHHIGRNHIAPLATLTDQSHRIHSHAIHSLEPAKGKVQRGRFKKERKIVWQAIHWFIENKFNLLVSE